MPPSIRPFTIDVDDDTLNWINDRVKTSRTIPDLQHTPGEEWEDGTPSKDIAELKKYWAEEYDWRKVEKKLNETYKMFKVELEEGGEVIDLHFVHQRSEKENAIPLLFAHGWPGNFTEIEKMLHLNTPWNMAVPAFHIIAPSIPGFVFSSGAKKAPGLSVLQIARIYHKLMLALGYKHYIGQGGDWGSLILRSIALQYPESLVGLHINFPVAPAPSVWKNPLTLFYLAVGWLTEPEKRQAERLTWFMKDNGYSRIQGTRPQTLCHALSDSPIGMLSWIREKLVIGSDPYYDWDKELVITWTMLYLLSHSSGHARIYKAAGKTLTSEVIGKKISGQVALGASMFPNDVAFMTKWWAEAVMAENITFWRVHDKGGHFPSVEVPALLTGDLIEFVQAHLPKERKDLLYGQ